jgi:hypothetical protein
MTPEASHSYGDAWWARRESNPHDFWSADFKSAAYTSSATRPAIGVLYQSYPRCCENRRRSDISGSQRRNSLRSCTNSKPHCAGKRAPYRERYESGGCWRWRYYRRGGVFGRWLVRVGTPGGAIVLPLILKYRRQFFRRCHDFVDQCITARIASFVGQCKDWFA